MIATSTTGIEVDLIIVTTSIFLANKACKTLSNNLSEIAIIKTQCTYLQPSSMGKMGFVAPPVDDGSHLQGIVEG